MLLPLNMEKNQGVNGHIGGSFSMQSHLALFEVIRGN